MPTKKNVLANIIVSLIIGVILGTILVVLASVLNFKDLIYWGLIIVGIITVISNIAPFVNGIMNIKTTQGVIDLIFATLGIVLGAMMIFMQGTVLGDILPVILAVYLIIIPVIRIALARAAWKDQIKKEWVRILIGVLIIAFLPAIFGAISDVFTLVLLIAGYGVIGISVLLFVLSLISYISASKKA
jgi:hypothetical protein